MYFCSERVKMEVNAVEEKCDRRIELLTQSIKKTRKRARIERIEEDDEEWVPSVLLHAEQTKVKVRELESCSSGSFLGDPGADSGTEDENQNGRKFDEQKYERKIRAPGDKLFTHQFQTAEKFSAQSGASIRS